MKKRNITVTIDKAMEWFKSGNRDLQEIALQAFNRKELICDFRNITTLWGACDVLRLHYPDIVNIIASIEEVSRASAAAFKLDIVRRALNLGQDLRLAKNPEDSYIYYPYNPFVTKSSTFYRDELNSGKMEVIGEIKGEGTLYKVLGGCFANGGGAGLGNFSSGDGVGSATVAVGFLGCASKEIASHFSRYFGMTITEAKYGDMIKDFEIAESKYEN